MKSQNENNKKVNDELIKDEITKQDILTLASLKKIKFTDQKFAKEHIIINKKSVKTTYEVEILDIDGKVHHIVLELKTYSK